MIKPILKMTCLTFACAVIGYVAAMMQYEGRGYPGLGDCIGSAQAQDLSSANSEAQTMESLPQPATKNGVNYMTGGIGDEERDALEAARANYNLHITVTTKEGTFTGDNAIEIDNAKGSILPQTASGPIFYAALPPGSYRVTVTGSGRTKQMKLVIKRAKPVYLTLSL